MYALQLVYPDHKWLAWKFSQKVPQGYWNDINNKREFMNWLGKQLDYQKMDDWYNLHWKDIIKYGGWSLLMKYNGSPSQILQSVYPEHKWIIWMFNSVSTGFWDIKENQKEFMNWLQKQLGYSKLDDWYNLTQKDIVNNGGVSLLTRYNSPAELICSIYNEHNWTMWRFNSLSKKYWQSDQFKQFMEQTDESVSWVKNENTTSVCYFFLVSLISFRLKDGQIQ